MFDASNQKKNCDELFILCIQKEKGWQRVHFTSSRNYVDECEKRWTILNVWCLTIRCTDLAQLKKNKTYFEQYEVQILLFSSSSALGPYIRISCFADGQQ